MLNKKLGLIAIFAALSLPAWSADDHKGHDHEEKGGKHAHEAKPVHGGVVSVLKDVNYELVAKADSLVLHVADHGKPVDLKGASAKLTLLSGTAKSEATLSPNGDRLEAKGTFPVSPGTKVVAVVTRPGSSPASVRFTLK